jgi:hypothetical protein
MVPDSGRDAPSAGTTESLGDEGCLGGFVIDPHCAACDVLAKEIAALDGEAGASLWWISVASASETSPFVARHGIKSQRVLLADTLEGISSPERLIALGMVVTPLQIVLSDDLRVRDLRIVRGPITVDSISSLCAGFDN